MRTLLFLLQKEFIQISRDPSILRIVFFMPIVQLIVLPFAADYEVKNLNLSIVDNDHSTISARLIDKMTASGYFRLVDYSPSYNQAVKTVEHDEADLILEIPPQFEKNLVRENKAQLLLSVNAVNGVKGGLAGAYSANIIRDFNSDIRLQWLKIPSLPMPVEIVPRFWYNPHMRYKMYMVPGMLVVLVTMVGAFLSSLNIVREKEIGTIEQLNVTPITKFHFILGKLIPFWIIGLIVLTLGIGVTRFFFGIVPLGSYGLIFAYAIIYLLAFLGFGLLLSTFADTQQQAMFLAFFFMMVIILLGGLYTNLDSMPKWAKTVTYFNPASYFIEAIRNIILKGSTFQDIKHHFAIMAGFALFFNGFAIWNYRKRW